MKKLLTLGILAIAFGFIGTFDAAAQQKLTVNKKSARAKDLYGQYDNNNPSSSGAEGAKVSVLLRRGNQSERLVSTDEVFYSGDKIKLVFDINFSGYAAIINTGPSGNKTILFPYIDNGQLVDHSVSPNAAVKLPRGNYWINFDSQTGDEQITVVFSKNPIAEVDNSTDSVTPESDGRIPNDSESDQILDVLNSKSLARAKSKDLFTQTDNDGTYSVAPNGLGNQPVAFTFNLKHR